MTATLAGVGEVADDMVYRLLMNNERKSSATERRSSIIPRQGRAVHRPQAATANPTMPAALGAELAQSDFRLY
jgi:hypothetical protein